MFRIEDDWSKLKREEARMRRKGRIFTLSYLFHVVRGTAGRADNVRTVVLLFQSKSEKNKS